MKSIELAQLLDLKWHRANKTISPILSDELAPGGTSDWMNQMSALVNACLLCQCQQNSKSGYFA